MARRTLRNQPQPQPPVDVAEDLIEAYYDFQGPDVPTKAVTVPDGGDETVRQPDPVKAGELARQEEPAGFDPFEFLMFCCIGGFPSVLAMMATVMILPNLPAAAVRVLAAMPLCGTTCGIWFAYKAFRSGDPRQINRTMGVIMGAEVCAAFLPLNLLKCF